MSKGDRHRPGRPACHASGQPSPPSALAAVCLVPAGSAAAACGQAAAPAPLLRLSQVTIQKFGRGPVQLGSRRVPGRRWAATSSSTSRGPDTAARSASPRSSAGSAARSRLRSRTGGTGSPGFVTFTVSSASRGVIASRTMTVCPNDWNRQRVDGSGPLTPRYPQFCGTNAFTLGSVWGIDRGWAVGLDSSAPGGAAAARDVHGQGLARPGVRRHVRRGAGRRVDDRHGPRDARPALPAACGGVLAHHSRGIAPPRPAAGRDRQLSRSRHHARPDPAPGVGDGHRPPGRPRLPRLRRDGLGRRPGSDGRRGLPAPGHERHGRVPVLLPQRQAGRQGEGGDARVRQPPRPRALALPPVRALLAPRRRRSRRSCEARRRASASRRPTRST